MISERFTSFNHLSELNLCISQFIDLVTKLSCIQTELYRSYNLILSCSDSNAFKNFIIVSLFKFQALTVFIVAYNDNLIKKTIHNLNS